MVEVIMSATPRPWHVYDRGIGFELHGANCADAHGVKCQGYPINAAYKDTFTKQDAELIIRAVNIFDEVRAVLKAIVSALDVPRDRFSRPTASHQANESLRNLFIQVPRETRPENCDLFDQIVAVAKMVLAKMDKNGTAQ